MKMETITVYKFTFPYENSELTIPLTATGEEEAKSKLRNMFLQWSNDLMVPVGSALSPIQQKETPMPPSLTTMSTVANSAILELRIEDLMKEIAQAKLKVPKGTVANTIKDWTGFKHEPANFAAILSELERIKRGHE